MELLARIIDVNRRRIGLDAPDLEADRAFSSTVGASSRLCIYGRMRPGGPDAPVLEPLGGEWSEGTFPGHLQGDGVCTLDECPGLAWRPTDEWNTGFLLTSAQLPDFWEELDRKEGDAYARLLTPVRVGNAEYIANIYASKDASAAQLLMLDGRNVHDDADFRL